MISKKFLNLMVLFLLFSFLVGCKEKNNVTVFNNLPESKYYLEAIKSLEEKKPIVVGFLATWCPHCQRYKPIFEEATNSYKDKVTFIHIDIDDEEGSKIVDRFQVMGVPTSAFIRQDGSVLKIQSGAIEKDELIKTVETLINEKLKKEGDPIAPFSIDSDVNEIKN